MWLLFIGLILFLLASNINIYVRNYKSTTKIYAKVLFIYFPIRHKRILKKIKENAKNKELYDHIDDIKKILKNVVAIKSISRYSVINQIYVEKVNDNEINSLENSLFYILTANLSSYINSLFKAVYLENYVIKNYNDRIREIDYFIHIKTTVFSALYGLIRYYIRKGKQNG